MSIPRLGGAAIVGHDRLDELLVVQVVVRSRALQLLDSVCEAREGSEVRQVMAVEIDVVDLGGRHHDRARRDRRDDAPTEKGDVLHVHPHGGPRLSESA